ncbi:hypothetical protein [Crenobacter intestini]|uniref:Uncharacterized protein n=1 Tax=Crenobacter intestini TaxID=2563443 RepID=A0A4T0UPM2_9NEIS|nr:hypothetical protein [Crenobacter intestini]TIC80597.1 hypothetical protein E5K04_12255 [Crenobacter intestini]
MEPFTQLFTDETAWLSIAALAAALGKFAFLLCFFIREAAKAAPVLQPRISASISSAVGGDRG